MKKMLAVVLMLLFVIQTQVVVMADQEADVTPVNPSPESISVDDIQDMAEYEFSFETVAKNSEAELLIDKSVNSLRLVSLKTGKYFDTKVMNGQIGNEVIRNTQKADFSVTYYTDLVRANTTTMENYTMSIASKQVVYTNIDNGIRCSFLVGEGSKLQLSMFPMYMSKERMEELVLQYLDDNQRAEMFGSSGYYTETSDKYIRNWEAQKKDGTATAIATPKLKRMYNYFYEVGAYNESELAADNKAWGVEVVDTNITLTINVDYLLDGKDLIVSLPIGDIVTDIKYPVSDLTLTPYLLSGDIYDEGYLFVPDGCGGIINFNNGKTSTSVLSIPIYGSDILKNTYFYSENFTQSTLPVIGMKKNDIAILGIIEEGAELATVTANVSGKVDEYNKVNVKFDLYYMEKMPMTIGFGNHTVKYANSSYKGNITMRYKLLEGENANYTGMAKAYKSYLKQNNHLMENPVPENSPLYVELVATVPKEKMFLGIPYTSYTSMTSFNEAQDIIVSLKAKGIKNIVTQYTDWSNGGAKNTPFTDIRIISIIGGKSGLSKFLSYMKSEDIPFFPTVKLLTAYSAKGISGNKDISRLLNNMKATIPKFNMVTRQTNHIKEWLISPNFLSKYIAKVLTWTGKLGVENLAVDNAGALLYGDYNNKRQLMRSDALPLLQNALESLSQNRKLLFSNANSYAYTYASYIADLPTYSSGRRTVDYSVPFVQMVLENDVPYSMEAFNENSLQGFNQYLLKAIETKSNLKWILTNGDESEFSEAYLSKSFTMKPYFQTKFSRWENKISGYYNEYNVFYQKVKNAEIKSHEVVSSDLVKVTYTNNFTVYINYSKEVQIIDEIVISPLSYIIKE